jgi:hypothetical protein
MKSLSEKDHPQHKSTPVIPTSKDVNGSASFGPRTKIKTKIKDVGQSLP